MAVIFCVENLCLIVRDFVGNLSCESDDIDIGMYVNIGMLNFVIE